VLKLLCSRILELGCDSNKVQSLLNDLAAEKDSDNRLGFFYREHWARLGNPESSTSENAVRAWQVLAFARADVTATMVMQAGQTDSASWVLTRNAMHEYLHVVPTPGSEERFRPFHASFAEFVRKNFDSDWERKGIHARIAEYCERWSSFGEGWDRSYAIRFAPSHLAQAAEWDRLAGLLTDLPFLEAKADAGLVGDLIDDLRLATKQLPVDCPRRSLISELGDTLDRWRLAIDESRAIGIVPSKWLQHMRCVAPSGFGRATSRGRPTMSNSPALLEPSGGYQARLPFTAPPS
jgi:hypothetical protein